MPFISNTEEQRKEMLADIDLTMADLFSDIPADLRYADFNLPQVLPNSRSEAGSLN